METTVKQTMSTQACCPDVRRVLLAITALPPGGGETVVCHLARQLRTRGVDGEVVCLSDPGELGHRLADEGVPLICLNSKSGYDLRAVRTLSNVLKSFAPDVVNTHDRPAMRYTVAAAGLRRWPIVHTAHGLLYRERDRSSLRDRLLARRIAAMTAVSAETAERHKTYLGWRRPVHIVPNGVPDVPVDASLRRAIRAELGIPPETFVFLAVGNARAEKGFEDLLAAAARVRDAETQRPAVCLVAGRMPETDYCRKLRAAHERLKLGEMVRWLGFRPDADRLRAGADAFVLASWSEGLPMVVLEAMMAGLPIVATKVGGVPAALSDSGVLVPPRSPEHLAQAMQRLLVDRSLAERLGASARRRALVEYSVDEMTSRYLAVYQTVSRGGCGAR